jgi:hypothetical protein
MFPCKGKVPVGIQPCRIQEKLTSMTINDSVDFMPTVEYPLLWDGPDPCHKKLRSSFIFGNVHSIGPQEQGEQVVNTVSTSLAAPSDENNPVKITSTTIRICDCSYSTLQELLLFSSSFSFEDLSNVCEIHMQGIHRTKSPTDINTATQSSPSPISDVVITLLQHTRLKRLILRDCNLHVSDLFAIMKVLRQKHFNTLEHLDLRYNGFAPRVLQWILSIHLGSLQSLKVIYLRQGIRCMVHQSVRNAITQGLDKNRFHTLHYIDLFHWDRSIEHILDVNRAGRRVFQLESFPLGLWPFLLERVTKKEVIAKKEPGRSTLRQLVARQASVLYYMLRNGPHLLQQ